MFGIIALCQVELHSFYFLYLEIKCGLRRYVRVISWQGVGYDGQVRVSTGMALGSS